MEVKFLKYDHTPKLKTKGIAHVFCNGFILKFKIHQNSEGNIAIYIPSYPVQEEEGSDIKWHQWFQVDSKQLLNEIHEVIKKNLNIPEENPVPNIAPPTEEGKPSSEPGNVQVFSPNNDLPF